MRKNPTQYRAYITDDAIMFQQVNYTICVYRVSFEALRELREKVGNRETRHAESMRWEIQFCRGAYRTIASGLAGSRRDADRSFRDFLKAVGERMPLPEVYRFVEEANGRLDLRTRSNG